MASRLRTPEQVHGVTTPEAYRALQRVMIATGRARAPHVAWRDPWLSLDQPTVYVGAGKWLVRCVCGNCPSVDPDWRLACCIECGAILEHLQIPDAREAIEAVLLKRPRLLDQNWRPPTTVDELRAENVAHGDPIP